MRNTGWYIPYWRKARKKGKPEKNSPPNTEEVWRSDEQLEAVRERWIDRYRRTARAFGALGLSVGSSRTEAQARYDALRAQGRATRDVDDAYRYLLRILPPSERRKKRASGPETAGPSGAATKAPLSVADLHETVGAATSVDGDASVVAADLYVEEADALFEDDDDESLPDENASSEADAAGASEEADAAGARE